MLKSIAFIVLCIALSLTVNQTASAQSANCATHPVQLTLQGESIRFCAPTAQAFTLVKDDRADPEVSYAALTQNGGSLNIRAVESGARPGIGRPVYTSGQIDAYRQAVRDLESAKTGGHVSDAPAVTLWGQSAPGLRINGETAPEVSLEWAVEHHERLWLFVLTWDTAAEKDWQVAAQNLIIDTAGSSPSNSADQGVDLGALFDQTPAGASVATSLAGPPVDVGLPVWWNGIACDNNAYVAAIGRNAYALGGVWHGVSACGPRPEGHSALDRVVAFAPNFWGEYEFECVELVMRFLYQQWAIHPWPGNANKIANAPPAGITFYRNGNPALVPGDILTENSSAQNYAGHTAIITRVALDATGSGAINIIEQNASAQGARSLSVINNVVQPDAFAWGQTIQGWLHANANTATPPPMRQDTIGIYRNGTFYLRNANTTGFADVSVPFAPAQKPYPVVGDWIGQGIDTIGVYDQGSSVFYLRNANTSGRADLTFVLGVPGDQPLAGRWQGAAAHDGIGVFRPSNGLIYLKNELISGFADVTMVIGVPGDVGIAGDWTGKGYDSPGVFRPTEATFYLSDQVMDGSVYADHTLTLGLTNDSPLVGDWTGALGHDGVGVFRLTNGLIYLKNDLSTGYADVSIVYGIANDIPVAGHWIQSGAPPNVAALSSVIVRPPVMVPTGAARVSGFDG